MDVVASWPVRVVAVVTMRATRDALRTAYGDEATPFGVIRDPALSEIEAAEQRMEALEAVAEAARAYRKHRGLSTGPVLDAALARLAETQNGQTAGGGERVETAADNASLTPAGGEPVPAPAVCPCCGDPGDCGEDCA